MESFYDEFSKSLAASVPRRESLRRMGAVFAGAVLGQLGLGTAWAKGFDHCKAFCRCSNRTEQNACLAACRNCNSNPTRLCGSCGSGYACTDHDVRNCGSCGNSCQPGQYETAACVSGQCEYSCVVGTVNCDETCADLANDFNNCGACGNVCPDTAPDCIDGVCSPNRCSGGQVYCPHTPVGPGCTDLQFDGYNCGACGIVCGGPCLYGVCYGGEPPEW